MSGARERLIVALDLPDRESALAAVDRLSGHVGCFKLGLEIFIAEGPSLVQELRDRGEQVFLDLKLHDIPNTVGAAVRSACRLGIRMLTVHASGGPFMLRAAVEAARETPSPPLLLAVTALTSLSRGMIRRIGISSGPGPWVERLARIAADAGIGGLVASPLELERLRRRFGASLRIVTPGIRPTADDPEDQSRVATPRHAIQWGADYLVVGRPILRAKNPAAAADAIVSEIEGAMASDAAPDKG